MSIGKHNNTPDSDFDPEQLRLGIKVEQEHTDDLEVAKNIAKDHLVEIKNYYTLLLRMEKQFKVQKESWGGVPTKEDQLTQDEINRRYDLDLVRGYSDGSKEREDIWGYNLKTPKNKMTVKEFKQLILRNKWAKILEASVLI